MVEFILTLILLLLIVGVCVILSLGCEIKMVYKVSPTPKVLSILRFTHQNIFQFGSWFWDENPQVDMIIASLTLILT
jgi:hypothetical protein